MKPPFPTSFPSPRPTINSIDIKKEKKGHQEGLEGAVPQSIAVCHKSWMTFDSGDVSSISGPHIPLVLSVSAANRRSPATRLALRNLLMNHNPDFPPKLPAVLYPQRQIHKPFAKGFVWGVLTPTLPRSGADIRRSRGNYSEDMKRVYDEKRTLFGDSDRLQEITRQG